MYRILVCDDEKDIVSALKIYLMADGYQVFPATWHRVSSTPPSR